MKKTLSILMLASLFAVLIVPTIALAVNCVDSCVSVPTDCMCGSTRISLASCTDYENKLVGQTCAYCWKGVTFKVMGDTAAAAKAARDNCSAFANPSANPSTNPAGNVIVTETSITTVEGLLAKIETIYTYVFTGLLALAGVFLVIAGYYFVTGGSEPEKVNKARQMLINALIGVAIGVLGKGLIAVIGNLLK